MAPGHDKGAGCSPAWGPRQAISPRPGPQDQDAEALPGPDVRRLQVPGHQGHEVGGHGVLHVEAVHALLLQVGALCGTHQHLHPRRGLYTEGPSHQHTPTANQTPQVPKGKPCNAGQKNPYSCRNPTLTQQGAHRLGNPVSLMGNCMPPVRAPHNLGQGATCHPHQRTPTTSSGSANFLPLGEVATLRPRSPGPIAGLATPSGPRFSGSFAHPRPRTPTDPPPAERPRLPSERVGS